MATANLLQTSVSGGTQNALSLQGDGVFFPKASTTSRLALTLTTTDKGFIVYDTTDNNIYFWNGAAWESVPSSGDAGANGSVQYNDNGIVSGASNFVYDKATSAVSVAGDLTVDTNVLKVDTTNNRVGIGTATPSQPLHVKLDQNAYTFSRIDNQNASSGAYAALMLGASGNSWGIGVGSAAANSNALDFFLDAGALNLLKMRLDASGNLLVGKTSGVNKIETVGAGVDGSAVVSSVSTVATTIYTIKQSSTPAMCVVFGDNGLSGFCDIVIFLATTTPVVVSSHTLYGAPAARTYTTATANLNLAIASGTFNIRTAALSTLNT